MASYIYPSDNLLLDDAVDNAIDVDADNSPWQLHAQDDCASQCGETSHAICCENDACAPNYTTFCDFDGCDPQAVCDDDACSPIEPPCVDEHCQGATHPCTDANCGVYTGFPSGASPHDVSLLHGHSQHGIQPASFDQSAFVGGHHAISQHHMAQQGVSAAQLHHSPFPHHHTMPLPHQQVPQQQQHPDPAHAAVIQSFFDQLAMVPQASNNSFLGLNNNMSMSTNTSNNNFLSMGTSQDNSFWNYDQQLPVPDLDPTAYGFPTGDYSSLPSSSIADTPTSDVSTRRSISVTPATVASADVLTSPFTHADLDFDSAEPSADAAAPSESAPQSESSQVAGNTVHMCKWMDDPATAHICGQTFEDELSLQDHCKSAHTQPLIRSPEGFRCQWEGCTRTNPFVQKSKLDRHLQVHTAFKPVQCPLCNLCLSAKQSLFQHLRTHTGEKPWKCEYEGCTQAFKQQSALTMHMRTHTGYKPLVCGICSMTFSESSNLSKHRRIHELQGHHKCPTCGKLFRRLDQLRRHRQLHEKNEQNGKVASSVQPPQPPSVGDAA